MYVLQHHFPMLAVCSQNLAGLLACLPAPTQAPTQAHTHARTHARTYALAHTRIHLVANSTVPYLVCMYTQAQVSYRRFLFNPSFAPARQNLSACLLHPFTATDLFPQDNDEAVRVLPLVEFALPQLYP
jgi:hypothetical protein